MGLHYEHLDSETRIAMLREVDRDIGARALYISPRLTDQGAIEWEKLMRKAAQSHHDVWLENQLRGRGLVRGSEHYVRNGRVHLRSIPVNAAAVLAEGEFNRFYIRGLCLRAQSDGINAVVVYRARHSAQPRAESQLLLGRRLEPMMLLEDLRHSAGRDPTLLPYVNSGLSVCFP